MSDSSILWRRLDRTGHESARVFSRNSFWYIEGSAVFVHERQPCRLNYFVECDAGWRSTRGQVSGWVGDRSIEIDLAVDAAGQWLLNNQECPVVTGCVDIDFGFSPSTNTLPIRRLGLEIGEEAEVQAAWLRFPNFNLERLDQVYRRIDVETYRYESAGGSFSAQLQVNAAGLVTFYPGLAQAEVPEPNTIL